MKGEKRVFFTFHVVKISKFKNKKNCWPQPPTTTSPYHRKTWFFLKKKQLVPSNKNLIGILFLSRVGLPTLNYHLQIDLDARLGIEQFIL